LSRLDLLGDLRRTHFCGEVRPNDVGREVVLCGWVRKRRDHGGVIFVDLRDRTGIAQVVFKPDAEHAAHTKAQAVRAEWVLMVRGMLARRDPDVVNANLPTGEVELVAHELRILNTATTPPFEIEDDVQLDESSRLEYRIHDLRRPVMQRRLRVRHELAQSLRAGCAERGLTEVETPILARATPEGARDFLVPSRLQHGSFYALPQSPQIMKQMLMVAGFDAYFQLARCFRDEDQRADRQLEFTQLDLEMSFVGVDDVLDLLEHLTVRAYRDVLGVELSRPFPRIDYADAMARYGSDKPERRIALEIVELSDLLAESGFKVFAGALSSGGVVRGLPIHDAAALTRSELDRLNDQARGLGAKGLAWVRIGEDGSWLSPIAKFLSEDEKASIAARAGLLPGSVILFGADREKTVCDVLGRLRLELGEKLGRYDGRAWDPHFVVGFPLFEEGDDGKLTYMHMPFVAPLESELGKLDSDPKSVIATHYDLVMNGVELGSGSLRNHRSDIQLKILEILGYSEAEARADFGFMLDALGTGAPPHGGFAFGFDRLALMLAGGESLRDVIAFPKTQRAQDSFMKSPSAIDAAALKDLGLRLRD